MLHELIYFFSHLFNIFQSYLRSYQVNAYDLKHDDDELEFTKRKITKITSL